MTKYCGHVIKCRGHVTRPVGRDYALGHMTRHWGYVTTRHDHVY